jgi:hypothetical protein
LGTERTADVSECAGRTPGAPRTVREDSWRSLQKVPLCKERTADVPGCAERTADVSEFPCRTAGRPNVWDGRTESFQRDCWKVPVH